MPMDSGNTAIIGTFGIMQKLKILLKVLIFGWLLSKEKTYDTSILKETIPRHFG